MRRAIKDLEREVYYVSMKEWTSEFLKATTFSRYNPFYYLILLYLRMSGVKVGIKRVVLMRANVKILERMNLFKRK